MALMFMCITLCCFVVVVQQVHVDLACYAAGVYMYTTMVVVLDFIMLIIVFLVLID